jgi:two-component system KDP operon response regulator KdpE
VTENTAPSTDKPRVLVVEDEPQMRRFLRASLAAHGYELLEAGTAKEALEMVTDHHPDVILLDLGLPDGDGVEVTRGLREWSRIPVIVISARGREADKVEALDAGADDYLTKPFGVNELLARMRVALRHARAVGAEPIPVLELGPLRIDLARRDVTLDGREVHLTPIEYRLLTLLARNAGKVLTHRQLLEQVWGPGHDEQTHYLRVYMAQLRRKIEVDPTRPRLLGTEPGVGYRLRDRPA